MPSLNEPTYGREYWRSLAERAQQPDVLASFGQEFADAAPKAGFPRRDFLRMAAAALSLAGLGTAGCRRWPEQQIRPSTHRPEGTSPGQAEYYATIFELAGVATGVLAKSFDGRPIKIEGNPAHPFSQGAADAFAQASILDLYDPDRSRQPVERSFDAAGTSGSAVPRRWEDFAAFAQAEFARLRNLNGQGLAVLSRPTSSPTLLRLRDEWLKAFPRATWHTYEPLHRDEEIDGTRLAFGKPLRAQYRLEKARVIACFDADLLGLHPAHQRHARDWSAGRASGDQGRMNRLYAAETSFSLTGSVADHRLPVRPSRVGLLVAALAGQLGVAPRPPQALQDSEQQWIDRLARDIQDNRGAALVTVGPSQPATTHAIAHAINAAFDSIGQTVAFTNEPLGEEAGCVASISNLARRMRTGQVSTLLILDGNPVYDAPVDLDFDPAGSANHPITSIHLSAYQDETSARCRWHLPLAHYLECWGDGRAWDGTYSVQQPLILPLFDGKSPAELLAMLLAAPKTAGADLVRKTAEEIIAGTAGARWEQLLHDGVLAGSAWPTIEPGQPRIPAIQTSEESETGFELVFAPDISVYDGRFANNGWLQELPDPLTKITWDNAALLCQADADALGVRTGDVIRVRVTDTHVRVVEIPAYVMPGIAPGVVVLSLGYGRTHTGHIGRKVGTNVYTLRSNGASYAMAANITNTGRHASLAMTQDHHLIDAVGMWGWRKRIGEKGKSGHLIREASLREYRDDPHCFQGHGHEAHQLFNRPSEFNQPHAWGMAIDLNRCMGCSACVIACQVENNIPVVGKRQVAGNREMHWLRVDRYFKGSVDNPDVVFAPMSCSHCENAPCEQVCPVAATVHDAEGLSTMVYNRCVGTRYCSNNCPYKVRRFNYFDYHSADPRGRPKPWLGIPDQQQARQVDQIKRMAFNPDVTVRMRGVMEKCTYCVQRIQAAKIRAKAEHAQGRRPDEQIIDGEIVTACQGACPTQAIVFGDLNDRNSRVYQAQHNPRTYVMLEELNLRVRTKYLAKLRNPADDSPAHDAKPPHANGEPT